MRFSCNLIIQSSDVGCSELSLLGISCNDPTDLHLIRTTVIDDIYDHLPSTIYQIPSSSQSLELH